MPFRFGRLSRDFRLYWTIVLTFTAVNAAPVPAADAPHPVVAGFERFFTGNMVDAHSGGKLLLGELNCTSCHRSDAAIARKQAPILDRVGSRVRVDYLRKYLDDPQAVKPGTTMPNLFAGAADKKAKIEAITQLLAETGPLKQKWPDVRSALSGQDIYSKVGCVACHGPRDLVGQPGKDLPTSIVPLGELKEKYSIVGLETFLENPLQTRPSGRMPRLLNAKEAHDVACYLLQGIKVEILVEKAIEPKANDDETKHHQLVEQGKALFASTGCANCHQLTIDKKTIAPGLSAPPLAKLGPEGGCLADKPNKGAMSYSLNAEQKTAIASAIENSGEKKLTPAAAINRAMITFNCFACHSRDKIGGPLEALNKFFKTAQQEMGDEGRIPPPLDGVGAKLNAGYFKRILDQGAHDRPYMFTHMPGFGAANVDFLQPLFASIDHVPPVGEVKFEVPEAKVRTAARHMLGEQALSCIKCHTFNGVKAEGIQGIDMTMMPQRLNRDWFFYYVVDPQKYRPGTRMPSVFVNKVSPLPQVLDGKADTQMEAMWEYLKLGTRAALPTGMGARSIPLVPVREAIIYRNFIQGAGTRAIAVGYPEKVSLAFDANGMRLALIWQGAFIDAARHWTGRGEGFEAPLGDNVMALPNGVPFAVLTKSDSPWPKSPAKEQGYKFKGYRLTPDERPTFEYSFEGITIEDFPNPSTIGKEPALKRVLTLTSTKPRRAGKPDVPSDDLFFRAAVGDKIETGKDGWFKIDSWKMKIDSEAPPYIRSSGGKSELLVPVPFKEGKARIVQEFLW